MRKRTKIFLGIIISVVLIITLGITDAYRMNGAKKVTREFSLINNSGLLITDNIECIAPSEIYWFMHTKADIEIADNGKIAILTINGKQMKNVLSGDGEFSVMNAEALKGRYDYDADYPDIRKLTVHLEDVKSAEIIFSLEPI